MGGRRLQQGRQGLLMLVNWWVDPGEARLLENTVVSCLPEGGWERGLVMVLLVVMVWFPRCLWRLRVKQPLSPSSYLCSRS